MFTMQLSKCPKNLKHIYAECIHIGICKKNVNSQFGKPKREDTITNRMLHWSYTPEQKEEVKKALAAEVPKATILTYFYPEVTVEKMGSYRQKQKRNRIDIGAVVYCVYANL